MTGDLKYLADNRNQLWMAEVVAWLHDMGKCSDEMIEWQAEDRPPTTILNRNNYKTYFTHLMGSNANKSMDLLNESIRLKYLIEKGKPQAIRNENEYWLIKALGRCHAAAHIEKEGKGSVKQTINDTRLSGPFGFETAPLTDLTDKLMNLPYDNITNRFEFLETLKKAFECAPGDTQRPINEVTLWDWSSIVAALYKSALAGALLGNKPEPNDLKWRLLAIRINSEQIWGNASNIRILLARKKWINGGLDNVKNLLEDIYPLGNEVYRDENGSVFVVPDLENLLEIKSSKDGKTLKELINNELGYEGEIVVTPAIDQKAWWGQNPSGRPNPINDELPLITEILSKKPYSPADPDAVKKWWNNTNKNHEICTISWLRPQDEKGSYRKASAHWAKKATFRAKHWTSNRDETIWIDEIADDNGRICLITGKLDILKWLEPEGYIKTLLVKPPDSNHKVVQKTPSFARIRRVWETTKRFWDDVNLDINTIIDPVGTRLKIAGIFKQKSENISISSNNAYEAEFNGIRFSIFYTKDGEYFIIENLQRLAQKLGASSQESKNYCSSAMFVKDQLHTKTIKIYDSEGKYKINTLGYLTLSQIEPELDSYVPVIPILSEPSTFMAIVPANKAVKIARHTKEKYEQEMGKVRNHLPLTLGLVFAKSHTPLPALMDAGRRMLKVSNKEEYWILVNDSLDCGLNCTLKFNNGISWNVPIKMGDDITDDIWYPNFYVDGVPDDRSTAFEYPDNRWLVHVKELKKDDTVKITPSRFDFEFLDSASRRFEVSYDKNGIRKDITKLKRPYLLEELDDFERFWNILSEGLSRTQIKNIIGLIEAKREEWSPSERNDVFENYVHNVLHNANWKDGKPSELVKMENAAFSGKLRDVVELYMDILKIKDMEDKGGI